MKAGGFGGRGDFLSLSGDMIQDTLTLVVSRRRFNEEVGDPEVQIRPNEGDLVYFPLNKKVYRVMFVEHESVFYQSGDLPLYELNCELMEYTGETFNTGLEFIDSITAGYAQNINTIGTGINDELNNLPIVDEDFAGLDSAMNGQNDYYQVEGKKIIDFSEIDPFTSGDEY